MIGKLRRVRYYRGLLFQQGFFVRLQSRLCQTVRQWRISLLFLSLASPALAQDSAEQIFAAIEPAVFQIKIIETKSASQVALGTGFWLGDGLIATNYHVVANEILEPEKHRVEIEEQAGETLDLTVVTVDVINDLAVLRTDSDLTALTPFVLAEGEARQGSILYSLGNPHNIGMTVVQGNYNGFAEHSFVERIHFSGAVNAGMSGGPTVNAQAEVVGVNVASAGNQIGFLVPVKYLRALKHKAETLKPHYDLLEDMASQIATHTDAMIEEILSASWPSEDMGKARILGKVVDWMDCWGDSDDDPETGVMEIARGCNNADNVYVSGDLNTGFFEYEFFYKETPDWPVDAFYRQWRNDTSFAVPGNRAAKKHVGNYDCVDRLVTTRIGTPQVTTRRLSICMRAYKKLPGLYDVFYLGVTSDKSLRGVMDHFTLSGVTEASAKAFIRRFVEALTWQ